MTITMIMTITAIANLIIIYKGKHHDQIYRNYRCCTVARYPRFRR
jgi:hypothetical protein